MQFLQSLNIPSKLTQFFVICSKCYLFIIFSLVQLCQHGALYVQLGYLYCYLSKIGPGATRRYAPRRWLFDSRRIYVRRGRVRSPHISADRPAAGSQRA